MKNYSPNLCFSLVSKAFSLLVCLVRLINRFKHDRHIKKKKKKSKKISDTQKIIAMSVDLETTERRMKFYL